MKRRVIGTHVAIMFVLCTALYPLTGITQSSKSNSSPTAQETPKPRDGQHDFDWDIGSWSTHQRRLLHPLTGSTEWVDYHGTDVVRRIWDGANIAHIQADGPAGHLEL